MRHPDLVGLRVLDGAMATELERRGCDLSGPLWSARVLREWPGQVAAVHAAYLEAGADCLLTASYQISQESYSDAGLTREAAIADLRHSVRLAAEARAKALRRSPGRRIWLAASLGPYGAALHNGAEYHGRYSLSPDDLAAFHARRLDALRDTEADLLAFETVPSLEEAQAILAALQTVPGGPAWVSFTCADERRVAHGELLSECARLLSSEPRVAAIGINCTAPRLIEPLIGEVLKVTSKPVFVYPNSGEGWDADRRCWIGNSDVEAFSGQAEAWYRAGAQAVGGCCRTGPEHVRAAARAAVALSKN